MTPNKEALDENKSKYYIIKDYVVGFSYIVDERSANILYGGTNEENKILNLDYLTTMNLKQNIIFGENKHDAIIFVQDQQYYKSKTNTKNLKHAIMSYYVEISQGNNPQLRRKTQDEISNGTTIRLIGISKTLDAAVKTYEDIKEKERKENIPEIIEKERVFVKYPHSRVPKSFGGKVVESKKTTREFI